MAFDGSIVDIHNEFGGASIRSSWPRAARFAPPLVLVVLSLLLFGRGLFGSEALYYRDILHTYWPLEFIANLARTRGSQWNPFYNVGLPMLGYLHGGIFYPPNFLYQFLEFPRAYALNLLIHHCAASVGTYVLCRRLGYHRLPSLGGAVAFSLTGFIVGLAYHGPFLSSAAYVPWVGALILGPPALLPRALSLAVLLAAQVLTGEPQLVILSALLGFTLCVFLPTRRREAVVLAGALALAAVLSAFQLLPAWQLFQESSRSLASGFVDKWSLHPGRVLEAMIPFPYGGYLEVPQFWAWATVKGPGSVPWAMSVYLGSSTMVLAALGIGRDRRSYASIFLVLLGLSLALGQYLPGFSLIHTLPPLRFFRYPQKYFLLSALGAVLLASAGLQNLLSRRASRPIAGACMALALVAIALGAIARDSDWALSLGRAIFDRWGIAGDPHLPLQTLRASFQVGAPFALAVAVLALLSSRTGVGASTFPAVHASACILIVAVDLFLAAQRVVWFGPIDLFRTVPPVVAKIREAMPPEGGRFFRDDASLDRQAPHSRNSEELVERRWWELETLKSNLGALYGLEEASGRLPFLIRRYGEFMGALAASPAKRNSLLNSCVALAASSAPVPEGMRVALTAPELRLSLLTVDGCLPRLRSVQSIEHASSAAQALHRVAEPGFDLAHTAVVEGEPNANFESATIDSIRTTLDGLEARVHAGPTGAFLVFSTVFYPGWTARLDGVDTAVRAVNGLLLGARIPSGTHTLAFRFREATLPFGVALSSLGLLGMVAALAIARFRRSP